MKKTIILCLLCLLAAIPASGESSFRAEELRRALVREYGYTEAEAAQFIIEEQFLPDGGCETAAWLPEASNERYVVYRAADVYEETEIGAEPYETPYWRRDTGRAVAERALRVTLRQAREAGWFTQWNQDASEALVSAMLAEEQYFTFSDWLFDPALSGSAAIRELFVSVFGHPSLWGEAARRWYNTVLREYGFSPEAPPEEAEFEYTSPDTKALLHCWVFEQSAPAALNGALSGPLESGWQLAGGVVCQRLNNRGVAEGYAASTGLAAFRRDGELLLAMLTGDLEGHWQLTPVSKTPFAAERALKLTLYRNAEGAQYLLSLPVEKRGETAVQLLVSRTSDNPHCFISRVMHADPATGEGVEVTVHQTAGSLLYLYDQTGCTGYESVYYPALADFADIGALPVTAEEIRALRIPALPEGWAAVRGVHLRAKTSSRSTDLGTFVNGAIVRIVDQAPGDPYPWFRVEAGELSGWSASNYVAADMVDGKVEQLHDYLVPPVVAFALKPVALKKGTGLLDGRLCELPSGTVMQVVLERDGWYYVVVPDEPERIGLVMTTDGLWGWVRQGEVQRCGSLLQAEWLVDSK